MRGFAVGKRTFTLAVGIVAFIGATWVAWAEVGSAGTVLGCVSPSGLIRGIDETSGTCRTSDTTLSWYTKAGADALFLPKTGEGVNADMLDGHDSGDFLRASAKASDADSLDGWDSSDFLTVGAGAGGALVGAFPSPKLARDAVDTDAIQPGAVTADKLHSSLRVGGGVSVVDSTGAEVGKLVSGTGEMLVRVDADSLIVKATTRGFVSGGTFVYQESGCAGAPLITSTFDRLALAPVALVKPGEAWIPDLAADPVTIPADFIVYTQTFVASGRSTGCMEASFSAPTAMTPLRMISLNGFVAPFRLQ
jgi:hypothetical protein